MTESRPDDLAVEANPTAVTAGEEDHADPWQYAGEEVGPPEGARPLDEEGDAR
jgi:hypothetical protein